MNLSKNITNSKWSKILLGILIAAFIVSSISGIMFMADKYNIISMDDKKININEFIRILNNEKQKIYLTNQSDEQLDFLNSKQFMIITLNKLINESLIEKEIENFKLKEPDEIILKQITKEKYFYTNNKFDLDKFHKILKSYNMSDYSYMEMLRNNNSMVFLNSLINLLSFNNFIVNNIFNKENGYKAITIFSLSKKLMQLDNIDVNNEDINNYYKNNISNFNVPETRKIDYIEFEKFTSDDSKKIEELLLTSDTINDIAKSMNVKLNTLGYITIDEAEKNKEYNSLEEAFTYKINDFSTIKKINNKVFIFSVTDIKNSRTKTIDEVKDEIKNTLINQVKNDKYKNIVMSYVNDYIKDNYNRNYLTNKGFKFVNLDISKKSITDYDIDFINNVLNTEKGKITDIFVDNNKVYFAYIRNNKVYTKNSEYFTSNEELQNYFYTSLNEDLKNHYINYLQNVKYQVKINYKLLNLIK